MLNSNVSKENTINNNTEASLNNFANNSIYIQLSKKSKKPILNNIKNRLLILSPTVHEGLEKECNKDDFEALEDKVLGKGGFGQVWKVRHKTTNKIYAVKVINKDYIKKENMIDQINREIEIMYRTDHPHIIKLYNHFEDDENFYLIMHCAGKGQLYHLLKRSKRLDEKTVAQYMREVISAVKYLHSMCPPIIHRDIKPENVLLDSDGRAKLADFGWSNFYDENKQRETYCGTPEYLAPEMVNKSGHNESIDVWSLGVLMFELIAGRPPFVYKGDTNELYNDIKSLKIKWTDDFPILAKNLISKILKPKPSERLSLDEIVEHPWFKDHAQIRPTMVSPNYDPAAKLRSHLINVSAEEEDKIVSEIKSMLMQRRESIQKTITKINDGKIEIHDIDITLETELKFKKEEISLLKEDICKKDILIEQLKAKLEKVCNDHTTLSIRDNERNSFIREIESKTKLLLEAESNFNLMKNEHVQLKREYTFVKDSFDEISLKNIQLEKIHNELTSKLTKLEQEKQHEIINLEKKLRLAEVSYVRNDSTTAQNPTCDPNKIFEKTQDYVSELVDLVKTKFFKIEEKLLTNEKSEAVFRQELMNNLDKKINEIVNYFKECYDRLINEEKNWLKKQIDESSTKNLIHVQSLEWYKQQTAELSQFKQKFNQDKNELFRLKNENSTLFKSREVLIEKNNYLESYIATQNEVFTNLKIAKENYKNAFLESEKLFQKYVANKNLRQLINFKYNIVEC